MLPPKALRALMVSRIPMGYRRAIRLRPVNSLKHVVDSSATLTAGTQLDVVLYDAVQTPVLTVPAQVMIGARISSVYLKVEVSPNETDAGAIPNVYMFVMKKPSNALDVPDAASVGTSDNKRWVLHQEMVMLNNLAGGNPRVMFQGVIKIPRGLARLGNDDTLIMSVKSTAVNIALCIQCIYKEFR